MNIRSLVTGFLLGIMGTFFGAWFSHIFSERRRRKEEFNKAAAIFRNAFLPEITYLRYDIGIARGTSTDSNLSQFLKAGLVNRHTEALEIFGAHLSNRQRRDIDKAWQEYQTKADSYKSMPMLATEKGEILKKIEAFLDDYASLK